MRLRISNIIMLLLCISIGLAWYADRNFSPSIVGTWHYSTPQNDEFGFTSQLSINEDGTFETVQTVDCDLAIFAGNWTITDDGKICFEIRSVGPEISDDWPDFRKTNQNTKIGDVIQIRYAILKDGSLLLHHAYKKQILGEQIQFASVYLKQRVE